MSTRVTVVDYGSGNLLSVCRALRHCDAEVTIAQNGAEIAHAERLVLPEWARWRTSMRNLERLEFVEPIRAYARTDRPLLGICVGMQVMFEAGEEFGFCPGLGLLGGRVRMIPRGDAGGAQRKVPHIGWNTLTRPAGINGWDGTVLADLPEEPAAYFLHSFAVEPSEDSIRLAECDYDGATICAAVRRSALYGCQFHPEKSGEVGLTILRNFLAL